MDGQTIFEPFHPDDEVEIVDVDHTRSTLSFRSGATGRIETLPYPGLNIVGSTMQPGRVVPIRYGVVTADEARHSKDGRMRGGARKISAMGHLRPTVSVMTLGVMRWTLGDEGCAYHLSEYARNANTAQARADYVHGAHGQRVEIELTGGCARAIVDLRGARVDANGIHLEVTLPDLVASAAVGHDASSIIGHPAIRGTIQDVSAGPGGGSYIRLRHETMAAAEAVASVTRLARAA